VPHVKRKGDKAHYEVIAHDCLGCACFTPGHYQHRGASGAGNGTHATGHVSPCCLRNAYHGCPAKEKRGETKELLAERKAEGWKKV
jgi:hypothetical protein